MATLTSDLCVVMKPLCGLTAFRNNARTHSRRQIRQIAESIKAFGFTNPVLLGPEDSIIAGHGRVQAAKLLGMTDVPTIPLAHLSEDQIRAYVLVDNKLAENAGWDRSMLAIEFQHLLTLDLDITITGFEVPEIDLILIEENAPEDADEGEDLPSGPPVTVLGDLWELGGHRIFCGDSLLSSSFETLLGGSKADMVLVDPPYNVKIDGHATGNGATTHREFAMGCGEMSSEEFRAFLLAGLGLLAQHSKNGSVHFVFMSWHHLQDLLAAGDQVYDKLLNLIVWNKDRAGMGSLYRSQHELCPVFRNGEACHRNNIQLGRFGRYRTNVWNYPGSQTMSKRSDEADLLHEHPTPKNIAMLADAILDCSACGDTILDGFLGSGSTLLAAERVRRLCYGIEIDPLYVDLTIRRWERYTGGTAVHAISRKNFSEITAAGGGQ